ncbi:formate dehydrogenase accessory sulfurtransferase FdhD [Neobacillus cucumis]|uniref:Sulfur carrier protein FdhD n=1 Tax=Neobacillus cucumis TaxID=1740721 RepID=A0A2N5HVM0_9BACI|nr:formate dehydrogenase accessory sulfurtransferase FdhD [Neobacillus cucumis]PLS09556.1 formate dehydrogenase family accessory protein FdhD [Neobacillus cucumis]
MKPIEVKREILRLGKGYSEQVEDSVVTEYPVTIKINGEEFVTLICSPEHIEDLVIGYLASEGVIRTYEEIEEVWMDEKSGFVHVKASKINPYYQRFHNKRYVTSCCGMSRQGFVFVNDALQVKKRNTIQTKISSNECFKLMNDLQQSSITFKSTGGVHNASLCLADQMLINRMDIGRHNALDKIYGYCLRNDISLENKLLVFSGRISSEILLKAAKIGCEMVLSKSAPTELALQLAEQLGITTIGFIRNESLNVYTCPERFEVG